MIKYALVELELGGLQRPIRIFKNKKAYMRAWSRGGRFCEMDYADAVAAIRHQIFVRSNSDCELCGSPITEQGSHMHETHHRGKGGEISLANSVLACAACHKFQHRDREPKFNRRKP